MTSFKRLPSPNFNERKLPLDMLVLHYTGMENGDVAIERLRDEKAQVSAHYVVDEDGHITQLVEEDMRAWHAGVSYWRGETDINSRSIGVEIVNGGHDFGLPAFPDRQIESVIALSKDIVTRHSLAAQNIVGHSDIAPGRKLDPGERFPWERLAKNGIGVWPEEVELNLEDSFDPELALEAIGYDNASKTHPKHTSNTIFAFQQRWLQECVTGELCDRTRNRIAQIAAQLGVQE